MKHLALPALVVVLAATGCGPTEPTGPKQTLSEKEKQQVRELEEHRQKEWSPPGKAK